MAIIDPEGLFNGDRLRRCSDMAQSYWPRLFLASNGFARLEINYVNILGRAFSGYNRPPSEADLRACIAEYVRNYLLFLYPADGRLWGQWDTRPEFLPRYKTAADRRSPIPPEPAFTEWKTEYRSQNKGFPKYFGNFSRGGEKFLHGVGVGVGVGKTNAQNAHLQNDAQVGEPLPIQPHLGVDLEPSSLKTATENPHSQQEAWFRTFWAEYWHRKSKKEALHAFRKHVRTKERFDVVMTAVRNQRPEMLARAADKRPYAATWLNGERWNDEAAPAQADSIYQEWEPPTGGRVQ